MEAHVLVPAFLFSPRSLGNPFIASHCDRVCTCHSLHQPTGSSWANSLLIIWFVPVPPLSPPGAHSQRLPAEGMGPCACRCGIRRFLGGRSRMYRPRLALSAEGAGSPIAKGQCSIEPRGWRPVAGTPDISQGPAGCIPQTADWFAGQFLSPTQPGAQLARRASGPSSRDRRP